MELSDLRIIVTGAAQGMGAYFARRLAEAGAKVAGGDVNEQGLAALPAGIERRRLDVSDEADVAAESLPEAHIAILQDEFLIPVAQRALAHEALCQENLALVIMNIHGLLACH